ncbi:protein DEK isoform X2 [Cebidichthys violaceus]|uniref:protein DEK isoform X2 n=1 Tax=Cebidichthys violaceus TaxID=271503 RepID=UPI0035C9E138
MDGSVASEEDVEEQQETSQEDRSSPNKRRSKTPAAGDVVEGKRAKRTVERLDFPALKLKEKLKIGDGSGDKLGDIPRTGHQITKMKRADLKPLHAILFDRPGKMATLKKNLRLFNGFPFDADSEHYTKKREKLLKNSNFTNNKLKVVCGVLDLEKKGTHSDLVDRILTFLIAPRNSGKRLPVKKKRRSKKKLSGDDSKSSTKKKKRKPKPSSSSSSPKKSKAGSKSKAIVMDSSSDEEDEKAGGALAEAEGSDTEDKPSEKEEDRSDKSEESADEEEEEEVKEESPKSKPLREKSASKKTAPVKRARTPAKKTGPPKKRAKKDDSDESQSDSEADEKVKLKPKKKKPAPAKPAAKTKKADSSSNSKTNTNTDDSSDDDEPLIKMIKKSPSDEQLKETVKSLLKEADLEEMTMKRICQRVFDNYPDHDLSSKKDYIKQTVKSLIT